MVDSGIILIKYWLEISSEEQTRRFKSRIDDPRKVWKLSDLDLMSYTRWDDMLTTTDTVWAPCHLAHTRRQEARPPQHHHPPPRSGDLRTHPPEEDHLARPGPAQGRHRFRLPRHYLPTPY